MIANLKPYPEYKDSGLPWLDTLPSHWKVVRNGSLFSQRNQTGFGHLPILEVSLKTGVRVRNFENPARKQVMSDFGKYKRAAKGDLAYNMMRMWQGAIGVAPVDGLVSPAYVVARPFPGSVPQYYSYLFRTDMYMAEIDAYSTGIVKDRNRLYWDQFKQMASVFPPFDEQTAIVRFLDYANRRLERAIRAKRKVIALLNEQKQAIIHRAVTRGLDPSVPLKPSGIAWLGEIPAHWDFRAFARISRVIRGASPRPAGDNRFFNGDYISWLTVGEVTKDNEIYLERTESSLTRLGAERSVRFAKGALVLTNSGATLGVPKILSIDVCANDGVVAFENLDPVVDLVFAYYYLSTLTFRLRDELRQGGTQPNLNTGIIRKIVCPLPPKDEQVVILRFLKSELRAINTVISRTEREIALLHEYHTRLIADVVTGKLDVRKAARNLPAEKAEDIKTLVDAIGLDGEEEIMDDAVPNGDEE